MTEFEMNQMIESGACTFCGSKKLERADTVNRFIDTYMCVECRARYRVIKVAAIEVISGGKPDPMGLQPVKPNDEFRDLTPEEDGQLNLGRCPFCANGRWHDGPKGGLGENIECAICLARFNYFGGTFKGQLLRGPQRAVTCPACKHRAHNLRGCVNAESDNDCDCKFDSTIEQDLMTPIQPKPGPAQGPQSEN
jgi:hypothetical protein